MAKTTQDTSRTGHLLSLMNKGDVAFNSRDFAAMDAVHHPDLIAYITGSAEPVYGRAAHAAAMGQMFSIFPDVHVHLPYPVQFGSGDWITVITRTTGTFTGEMTLPDGTVIPRQARRSTSSSARPPSGTATSSWSSPPSGTLLRRHGSSAWPRPPGTPAGPQRPTAARAPTSGGLPTYRTGDIRRLPAAGADRKQLRPGTGLPPRRERTGIHPDRIRCTAPRRIRREGGHLPLNPRAQFNLFSASTSSGLPSAEETFPGVLGRP